MKSEDFIKLCELYGFAPSRALRELLEAVERVEREACAKVCDAASDDPNEWAYERAMATRCAAAIRARSQA